jgi:hypothetical protein
MVIPVRKVDLFPATGIYILLAEPFRVPPHIALQVDEMVFSISVRGTTARPVAEWHQLVYDRMIPVIGLEVHHAGWQAITQQQAGQVFAPYLGIADGQTCFRPVHGLLQQTTGMEIPGDTMHDLLNWLEQQRISVTGVSNSWEGAYTMPEYAYADVLEYIRKLRSDR